MKFDYRKYEDLRFTEDFNCASFAKKVAEDYGVLYPIDFIDHNDKNAVFDAFVSGRPCFDEVTKPQDFDLVYMKEDDGVRHIGLYFKPNKIYHLPRQGSPLFQKITKEIKPKIIGFYRLKS